MKLAKFDSKIIRIITIDDEIYEGIASYNSQDYDEHEFGRNEESIQIAYCLFYKNDIKKIEVLDNFRDKYGLIEEVAVKDGIDFIDEILYSEEEEHISRLLLCILDHIGEINYKALLKKKLEEFYKYTENNEQIELIDKIFSKLEGNI